jgi:hypothetical protein
LIYRYARRGQVGLTLGLTLSVFSSPRRKEREQVQPFFRILDLLVQVDESFQKVSVDHHGGTVDSLLLELVDSGELCGSQK